jgi:asparagine synthase (glutamine-hydrolysing)
MCGIAGIYSAKPDQQRAVAVRAMNNSIAHRGPDDEGYYNDDFVALAHRRLAILDLSPAGHQPMHDSTQRYEIIFNGEIYNFKEVRKELPNYPFQTQSDTEVILAAYQEWGPYCLHRFNGMFAFALWDKEEQSLFIARDRLGIKPLYYTETNGSWLFASEIRAILASGLVNKKLNRNVLAEFFMYQTVHAPRTLISNVNMLLPGHYMILKNGAMHITRWWSPKENYSVASQAKTYKEVCKDVQQLLTAAVERRLISDVPFGAFLSGGIDSSAVVGMMSRIQQQSVKTFTIAFGEKEFSEAGFAKQVANKFKTDHTEFLLKPEDFLKALPVALNALDHPSGDGPNSYIVSQLTRKHGVTMALSGLGGDELFAGYPVFNRSLQIEEYNWLFSIPAPLRRLMGSVVATLKPGIASEKLAQLLRNKDGSLYQTFPVSRQVGLPKHVTALTGSRHETDALREILERELSNRGSKLPTLSKVSVAEITTYMQNVLLRDTDQMSMAVALEVRVPFLDYELVEYVLGIPDEFKRPVFPKKLLVDSLGDLLPDEVIHRKKMGFVFPWELWLKNELRTFCEDKIQQLIRREIINGKYLAASWERFLKGDKNVRWLDMWLCVVLENWLEANNIEA